MDILSTISVVHLKISTVLLSFNLLNISNQILFISILIYSIVRFAIQNNQMDLDNEKREFSKRLKQALELTGNRDLTLLDIATKFNLQHPNKPVTPQTVHNWLIGASMPTSDKIETLAIWLRTSPSWLRYGKSEFDSRGLNHNEVLMLQHFRALSEDKQKAMIALLLAFQ